MDPVEEDRFVIYVRTDPGHGENPEITEQPLTTCSSYAEARRLRRQYLSTHGNCVIRFVGPTGGGD